MKILLLSFFAAIALLFNIISTCKAQAMVQLNLKPSPANVSIDANLKEWGDSLSYYSPEEQIKYTFANNKDTLYLAVKIFERSEITRVLHEGLTLSIDTKGKKKASYSLTYPVDVQGDNPLASLRTDDDEDTVTREQRDELLSERLTSLRGIKLTGFKDIEDDMITTSNTYGIRAAFDYDANGNLIYEEAIPLKFFHAGKNNEWAFNIRINGIQRPQASGGGDNGGERRGGFGGGSGGFGGGHRGGGRHMGSGGYNGDNGGNTDRGELFKSVDFWGKFRLASQ